MKITHTVVATGHYINIHTGTQELTIRTEHGTAQELLDEAREMLTKARRLLRSVNIIATAALQLAQEGEQNAT